MPIPAFRSLKSQHREQEDHWIPLSDLMTGLMMMFMLISIVFMAKINKSNILLEEKAQQVKNVVLNYDSLRNQLHSALQTEFKDDLPNWGAELSQDLSIRFKEPRVLFAVGASELKPEFSKILDDFFPRYVKIITGAAYKDSIEEVRIEGHTSSKWLGAGGDDAYFNNMGLSQQRTRTVLKQVLLQSAVSTQKAWLVAHLTANGLSSSHLITTTNGIENADASQRVEFRLRTNADAQLAEVRSQTAAGVK